MSKSRAQVLERKSMAKLRQTIDCVYISKNSIIYRIFII